MAALIAVAWCAVAGCAFAAVMLGVLLPAAELRVPRAAAVAIAAACALVAVALGSFHVYRASRRRP